MNVPGVGFGVSTWNSAQATWTLEPEIYIYCRGWDICGMFSRGSRPQADLQQMVRSFGIALLSLVASTGALQAQQVTRAFRETGPELRQRHICYDRL